MPPITRSKGKSRECISLPNRITTKTRSQPKSQRKARPIAPNTSSKIHKARSLPKRKSRAVLNRRTKNKTKNNDNDQTNRTIKNEENDEGEYELPPMLPENPKKTKNVVIPYVESELSDLCSVFNEYNPAIDGPIPPGKTIEDFVDGGWN